MSSLKSVIITLPKGLSKTIPANELNFTTSILNKARMDAIKITKQQEEACDNDIATLIKPTDTCIRVKKRRLDHLTWEEKLQRKKLKNRVAAQTSRDRKKAKLDELEETVKILKERNELLTQECVMLRSQNESLNQQYCSMCQARVGCAVPSLGSAVSPDDPLPQGGTAQPASYLTLTPSAAALLKILTLYLLSKNCLANSPATITSSDWKSSPKAFYEKLPPRWKQILIDQMNKCPSRKIQLKNLTVRKQWWGRHQKMWKPMEPVEA